VMRAVGRLVGIETIGDKVISTFYNTFDYFGYEREVVDWTGNKSWPLSME